MTVRGKSYCIRKKHNAFGLFILITFCLIVISDIYIYQLRNLSGNPIRSDGWGYYSYLPAVFDYHDLTFSFSDDPAKDVTIRVDNEGHYINKYPIGVAILESPFFFVVDIAMKIFDQQSANGYSMPYQIAMLISAIVYFLSGLLILYKVLNIYFEKNIVILTLILMTYATNLFHYASFDASFSHIYSFFLISLFVYITIKKQNFQSIWLDFAGGICLGLVFVTRNPNIIVVLFYFFYNCNSLKKIRRRIVQILQPKSILINICGFILPVSLQCIYWLKVSGKLIIRSYDASETFSWLFPHIINVLFSVQKGLFFYSPILLFSFIGIVLMIKVKNELVLPIFTVMLFHIYVTSSWDCWQYGGSFGQRPFIDFFVFYAIALAFSLQYMNDLKFANVKNELHTTSVLDLGKYIFIIFIFISIKLMLCYWHGILPFADATMIDIMNCLNWNFDEMRFTLIK